jgi:hypothetical protein
MKVTSKAFVFTVLVGALAFGGSVFAVDEQTLTGSVGDAMCGVKHMMDNPAGCTLGCTKKGSDYALIVDDKAYTLKTSTDAEKQELEALAGKMATVTGDVTDDTIAVGSVRAAE